ncbi:MAG: YhcH/YjgK/YiaL family protein [Paludibacter sp.]|nr:YhcH/YjgK/YiaL family protein [Paludibacter sp.]MDD4199296.1 YhcH/YjgK/YiaL family protein [Paludibacter sp.]MDD4427051.1 YhcH/YjgK/YiaL family protein [Paludibacter sp.]
MILDTLQNSMKYASVNPRFAKAFEYLMNNDLAALPVGKVELEGADLVVNVVEITGKTASEARMETHNKFIDIQVPVGKAERMGWKAAEKLNEITEAYSETKDITFFADKATCFIDVQPFEFAIFFPEDGHQPGISSGTYKKIIVKVRV